MPPTFGNGKICYIEIPAPDVHRLADFYATVVGWKTRERSNGSIAFDDGVGEVSGSFVTWRTPGESGLMVYIMVDSVARTCEAVVANGGAIVQPIVAGAPEISALFRDPAGNVIGLYQQRSRDTA